MAQEIIEQQMFDNEEVSMYDTGIERAFLACIMNEPKLIHEAEITIDLTDIYNEHNRNVYQIMIQMRKRAEKNDLELCFDPASMISLAEEYNWTDTMARKVGSIETLHNIYRAPHTKVEAFSNYMQILLQKSSRIKAYRKAREIQRMALRSTCPTGDLFISEVEAQLSELSDIKKGGGSIIRLGDTVDPLLKECAHNKDGENRMGVNVESMPKLMSILNGIRRRQFIIIFARPKTGKSTLLLNMAIDVAAQQIPVLYIDTEMSADEQTSRALSRWSGLREWDILDGTYLDHEAKRTQMDEISEIMKMSPLYYTTARGMSTEEIIGKMREFKARYVGEEMIGDRMRTKPCLIIYDWLKVADAGGFKAAQEHQQLGFISTKLNDTCAELDVPIICGAQANRSGNDDTIGIKSANHAQNFLADSDRILRFCTCLIWLRRVNSAEADIINTLPPELRFNQMLHIVDQRKGPTCMEGICLHLNGQTLTYDEKPYTNLDDFVSDEKPEKCKKKAEVKTNKIGKEAVKEDQAQEITDTLVQDDGDILPTDCVDEGENVTENW